MSTTSSHPSSSHPESQDSHDALARAHEAFYAAINQNCAGDATQMPKLWSHQDDVADFGPDGGMHVGWAAVRDRFAKEATMGLKGRVVPAQVTMIVGDGWGVTRCNEVIHGMMFDGKPAELHFRATNVFRKEGGAWKVVHHHTDLARELVGT